MRQVAAPADPDAPPRLVTLPASWDDAAAEALAVLSPGDGAVSVAAASAIWLGVIGQRARQEDMPLDIVAGAAWAVAAAAGGAEPGGVARRG